MKGRKGMLVVISHGAEDEDESLQPSRSLRECALNDMTCEKMCTSRVHHRERGNGNLFITKIAETSTKLRLALERCRREEYQLCAYGPLLV